MISILEKDVATNRSIGLHGANHILADKTESEQTRILTICNTGKLSFSLINRVYFKIKTL